MRFCKRVINKDRLNSFLIRYLHKSSGYAVEYALKKKDNLMGICNNSVSPWEMAVMCWSILCNYYIIEDGRRRKRGTVRAKRCSSLRPSSTRKEKERKKEKKKSGKKISSVVHDSTRQCKTLPRKWMMVQGTKSNHKLWHQCSKVVIHGQ